MKPKSKPKAQKELERLRGAAERLRDAAARCHWKFGCDDDGTPSDWDEWVELKTAIDQLNHHLK
jgi:hypothetical protein